MLYLLSHYISKGSLLGHKVTIESSAAVSEPPRADPILVIPQDLDVGARPEDLTVQVHAFSDRLSWAAVGGCVLPLQRNYNEVIH